MSKVLLRNINPLGHIDLPVIGREGEVNDVPGIGCLIPGEEFEVEASIAGRAPDGDDPGEGLLAQVGNYELVVPKKK